MKIVRISWYDSAGVPATWMTPDQVEEYIDNMPEIIDTVGFLIHSDKEKVVVAQSWHDENRHNLMAIPKKCIIGMKHIDS